MAVVAIGSLGYFVVGQGRWEPFDCVYMTVIVLTTVGFGELLPGFAEVEYARGVTMLLLVLGIGTFLYFASTLTAWLIEGDLRGVLRKKRMEKQIQALRGHIIVCGAGSTGHNVLDELTSSGVATVIIDKEQAMIDEILQAKRPNVFGIVGDATSDAVLQAANIIHAKGIVAGLANDKENLYLVVSARQANRDARIVARGSEREVFPKLRKAGADTVVSPNSIGGLRMASEMLRPQVVAFLDDMLRDATGDKRIEKVVVPKGSRFAGKKLGETEFRDATKLLILAARTAETEDFTYSPGGNFAFQEDMVMLVMGASSDIRQAKKLLGGPR